jgi:hypothetical protein
VSTSPNLSSKTIKLAILLCLKRKPNGDDKYNIIGRDDNPLGAIESILKVRFSDEQRDLASNCFNELRSEGLIRSTHKGHLRPEDWVDDNGKTFHSRLVAVTDIDAGVFDLTNAGMIDELDHDHPLLIASGTHAMVGTAIQYFPTSVNSVGVFDPWPTSGGARGLSLLEMIPITQPQGLLRFAAAVRVD